MKGTGETKLVDGYCGGLYLDGSNSRVLVKGSVYFNYCDGILYYTGIGENENGPCHIVYKLNICSNEKMMLLEESNEFFG